MGLKRRYHLVAAALLALITAAPGLSLGAECEGVYGGGPGTFSLATGSPGELDLLKALGEAFSREHNSSLCWVKAGSGDSLKLLKDKKVDMIMVHAPEAKKKAVAEGWAMKRTLIGSNEFYIVGPALLRNATVR